MFLVDWFFSALSYLGTLACRGAASVVARRVWLDAMRGGWEVAVVVVVCVCGEGLDVAGVAWDCVCVCVYVCVCVRVHVFPIAIPARFSTWCLFVQR